MLEMVIQFGGMVMCVVVLGYCIVVKFGMLCKVIVGGYSDEYFVYIVGVVLVSDLRILLVVMVNEL